MTPTNQPRKRRNRIDGRRHQSVFMSYEQVEIADGIARQNGVSRHAVLVLALRSGLGSLSHLAQAELWAMLPPHVQTRLRKQGVEPADRNALRERIKRRRLVNAVKEAT